MSTFSVRMYASLLSANAEYSLVGSGVNLYVNRRFDRTSCSKFLALFIY